MIMSKISELPDDLLVKILSYLPTDVAASTSVLSKQWQFLWLWSPNLEFGSTYISDSESDLDSDVESDSDSYFESLTRFLLRNLPLHRAPVIESFCLNLIESDIYIDPEDVKVWVQFSLSRDVRELKISLSRGFAEDILPSSWYTCKSLVTLELNGGMYMDVPCMFCLPSLKTLRLKDVTYVHKDSLPWLLSNCPVLEDLSLSVGRFADVGKMIVRVPSLQRLWIQITDDLDEFVIDTPSLNYLKLEFVDVSFTLFAKLIGSIPSVESLTLCLSFENISEVVFDDGFVFNKLKHLKLCTCHDYSSYVLVQLLKVSPNLRVLELFTMDWHGGDMEYWNQPSSVPECLLSSLETFKWSRYQGSEEERELVIYILQNANRVKTATFLLSKFNLDKTVEIKKELELCSRASTTCQLLFH